MIIPLGHRLLVKPEKIEDIDPSFAAARRMGLIVETDERKREQAAVDKGTVVSIGETAWKDFGTDPWCAVGDKILFTRYGGKVVKDGEDEYVILNDEDVIGRYADKDKHDN